MARHGPLRFRQRDLTAGVKALEAAGKNVARVTVEKDGRIVFDVGITNTGTSSPANPWEKFYSDDQAT